MRLIVLLKLGILIIFTLIIFSCGNNDRKIFLFNNIYLNLNENEHLKKIDGYVLKRYRQLSTNKSCIPPLNKCISYENVYEIFIGIPMNLQDTCIANSFSYLSDPSISVTKNDFYRKTLSENGYIIESYITIGRNKFYLLASTKSDSISRTLLNEQSLKSHFNYQKL